MSHESVKYFDSINIENKDDHGGTFANVNCGLWAMWHWLFVTVFSQFCLDTAGSIMSRI